MAWRCQRCFVFFGTGFGRFGGCSPACRCPLRGIELDFVPESLRLAVAIDDESGDEARRYRQSVGSKTNRDTTFPAAAATWTSAFRNGALGGGDLPASIAWLSLLESKDLEPLRLARWLVLLARQRLRERLGNEIGLGDAVRGHWNCFILIRSLSLPLTVG